MLRRMSHAQESSSCSLSVVLLTLRCFRPKSATSFNTLSRSSSLTKSASPSLGVSQGRFNVILTNLIFRSGACLYLHSWAANKPVSTARGTTDSAFLLTLSTFDLLRHLFIHSFIHIHIITGGHDILGTLATPADHLPPYTSPLSDHGGTERCLKTSEHVEQK